MFLLLFFLRRLLVVIPTFLGITLLAFLLIHAIPGDPVLVMLGERHLDPASYEQALHRLGLDQPLYLQYCHYLLKLLSGNMGESLVSHDSVLDEFLTLFPATVELSFCAMGLACILGILAGVIASTRPGKGLDHSIMSAAITGYAMPIFWWGLILIMLFSVHLGWTPVAGRIGIEYDIPAVTRFMLIDTLIAGNTDAFKSALVHLVLPTIVLGTIPMAVIARVTRSSMLEVLGEDYIRTARAKGVPPARVLFVHALRNALIPIVTVMGLQVGSLLGGAVLTETLFSWPGVGKWLIDAVSRRDYPVVQGGILLIATLIIFVNLSVDLLYGLINPRIRHAK